MIFTIKLAALHYFLKVIHLSPYIPLPLFEDVGLSYWVAVCGKLRYRLNYAQGECVLDLFNELRRSVLHPKTSEVSVPLVPAPMGSHEWH